MTKSRKRKNEMAAARKRMKGNSPYKWDVLGNDLEKNIDIIEDRFIMENTNLSELIVIGVGTRGKNIAEQIGKECAWVSCFSFQDEKEIDDWGEKHLSEKILAVIISCMDVANEETAVARLVKDAKTNAAFAIAVLGARGNNYAEIAENSEAVIICSKDQNNSEESQYKKMYAAALGLALANAPEAEVSLDVLDIAAILHGECQFGVEINQNASVAVKQAIKGLFGRNCLLYFYVPKGVSLYDVNEAAAKVQESLGEDANIIFGIKEESGRAIDSVQVVAYMSGE